MYDSKSGMTMPKKGGGPKGPGSLSNGGDCSKHMGGVSTKPTTSKNPSTLKGTSNGKGRSGHGYKAK